MRIRTALFLCLAPILLAAMEPSPANATDDYKNCTVTDVHTQLCSALHRGDPVIPFPAYNLQQPSKDQSLILSNVGNVPYIVLVEQLLRVEPKGVLKPGESINISAPDTGWAAWAIYGVVIMSTDGKSDLTPDAKALISFNQPTPEQKECTDQCTTRWDGCHQGCAQIEHSGVMCLAGCDTAQAICLSQCSK